MKLADAQPQLNRIGLAAVFMSNPDELRGSPPAGELSWQMGLPSLEETDYSNGALSLAARLRATSDDGRLAIQLVAGGIVFCRGQAPTAADIGLESEFMHQLIEWATPAFYWYCLQQVNRLSDEFIGRSEIRLDTTPPTPGYVSWDDNPDDVT